ncbi:hypothetical protein NIIDMKKI_24260 [Mycobacterium kansasii]|uniref:Uncharacterized protein n=1 Tax=Mycobacterium kansasii TaxID=1768 RepID=A0A7G1I8A7_MYCKA|nr:hypothetical protein NIIDMKKI_24260 [Mycobacterium kansasii]
MRKAAVDQLMCGAELRGLGVQLPSGALLELSHACLEQEGPVGDVLQAATGGIQHEPGTELAADIGNPLVVIGGYPGGRLPLATTNSAERAANRSS